MDKLSSLFCRTVDIEAKRFKTPASSSSSPRPSPTETRRNRPSGSSIGWKRQQKISGVSAFSQLAKNVA